MAPALFRPLHDVPLEVMTMMFDNTKQTMKFNHLCEFVCAPAFAELQVDV